MKADIKKEIIYQSPVGLLKIQIKNRCVYSLSKARGVKKAFRQTAKKDINSNLLRLLTEFLNNYFSKKTTKKSLDIQSKNIPLCSRGTDFQQKVWRYLRTIPCGQTRTYGETAKAVCSAGGARAVGVACARNPFLILVPCHRVTAQKGLGGFALGLSTKAFLLNHEKSMGRLKLRADDGIVLNKRLSVKSDYQVKTV